MRNYYKENYELFLRRGGIYKKIEDEECNEEKLVLSYDRAGNEVVGIVRNEREYLFGSRYDNEFCVNKWLESIEIKSINASIYIFGMGDIGRIKGIVKKCKNCNIIVYEPSLSYFKSLMELYDLSELICNDNVYMVAGDFGMKVLENTSKKFIDSTNYRFNIYKMQPQYQVVYEKELTAWKRILDEAVDNVAVNKNTNIAYGMDNLRGTISNYYDCIISNNVNELKETVRLHNIHTAILVSAGPSLDKNVELLKEAKGKALIVAVDTAIRPLMKRGIRPDLTVTVDSCKPVELFTYNDEIVDIPIITCISGNGDVIGKYPGKRIYEYELDVAFAKIYDKEDFGKCCLETGGSVAHNAFTFLREAGVKNIIMIGQDLAYPGNKQHAEDTFKNREKIDYVKKDGDIEVEDIYGNMVYTTIDMLIYIKWFQTRLNTYPELNVIDATEGGAKIEGTTIMTLRDAIDSYVKDLPVKDYENIINNMEPLSEDEINRRLDVFYAYPKELQDTKEDIDKAMILYDKLERLNEKGDYSSKVFKETVDEVMELSSRIKDSVFAYLTVKIKNEEEYDVLEGIYEDKETVYEEIKLIIDGGRKVLKIYKESYDLIQGMISEAVQKAKEKEKER